MVFHKKIETKLSEVWIDDEGILRVRIREGAIIDEDETKRLFSIYTDLGCKKNKVLQVLDARAHFTMTREARTFAAQQGKDFFIAAAIINNSFPIRIMFNLFNTFYRHGVPFRMFSREEEALKWLRTFRE